MPTHQFTVEDAHEHVRLDRLLTDRIEGLSRSRIQSLIRGGHAMVDGCAIIDPGLRLRAGQAIVLSVPEAVPPEPVGQSIHLDIVFEDEHLLVVNKPAGMVVHPGAGREEGTLVNALIAHCGESLSGIGGVKRPGIVHRLDRLTSGLIVVAKTDAAHHGLSEQFSAHGRDGRLTRRYRGFAWGRLLRPHLSIEGHIGRSPTNRRKMAIVSEAAGRHAVTHVAREQQYMQNETDVLEFTAELETGRTHQIRVHMASVGHPLLGDPIYGKGYATREAGLDEVTRAALDALARQALHAEALGFEHPCTGDQLDFFADLPPDLSQLKQALLGSSQAA